jgi:hypothetical protein
VVIPAAVLGFRSLRRSNWRLWPPLSGLRAQKHRKLIHLSSQSVSGGSGIGRSTRKDARPCVFMGAAANCSGRRDGNLPRTNFLSIMLHGQVAGTPKKQIIKGHYIHDAFGLKVSSTSRVYKP